MSLAQGEEWRNCMWHDAQVLLEEDSEIFVEMKRIFIEWIHSIDISSSIRWEEIKSEKLYLNFNYTKTLEKLYNIPTNSILHIHGTIGEEVIIGHTTKFSDEWNHLTMDPDGSDPLFDPYNEDFRFDELRGIISKRTDSFYKPINDVLIPKIEEWFL